MTKSTTISQTTTNIEGLRANSADIGTLTCNSIEASSLTVNNVAFPIQNAMTPLDTQNFTNAAFVDLKNTTGVAYDEYVIKIFALLPTAGVTTFTCSTNAGVSFDTGANYSTGGGLSEFSNGLNGMAEGISHVRNSLSVTTGCTMLIDTADVSGFGGVGTINIFTPGTVNGVACHTQYTGHTSKHESGGYSIMLAISGHYLGASGTKVNAFRVQSTTNGATISGRLKLYGVV